MDAFWQAVAQHDWAQPEIRHEFRVYYDDDGKILFYTMEDVAGQYITVDRHTFEQFRMDLRVKDGALIKITQDASWKLAPTESADIACHEHDVTVIIADETYSNKKYWKVITTHEAS